MPLFKTVFLFILFVLLIQVSESQVKISVGPSVGLTLPTGDYSGTTIDYYNGTKYGLSSGFNLGAVAKVKLPNIIRFRVAGNISFLKNTGNSEPGAHYVEVKHTVLMFSVGPEFTFGVPKSMITPYVGADLLITSFSGETTFADGVEQVSNGTFSMTSASRIGIGIGGGIEISVGKNAVDVGLRYNLMNLTGKSFEAYSSNDRTNSYLNLNDNADPGYASNMQKHPVATSRSISDFQINVAFLFGL